MKLARVIGSVVCDSKDGSLAGVKLLLLQPLTEALMEDGEPLVACDTVQAGVGDTVIWVGGREAALALENWYNPADAAVMGIVDQVNRGRAE